MSLTKGTLVFREWLEERGLLRAYVKYRAGDSDWDIAVLSPVPEAPHTWMGLAFNKYDTDEGVEYWSNVEREWCASYSTYTCVKEGMPLNDQLGMSLLLAELEAECPLSDELGMTLLLVELEEDDGKDSV